MSTKQFRRGDRVMVLSCPARPDAEGKFGVVVNKPAVGENPILRVRMDGSTPDSWWEIDGTSEKFKPA